MTSITDKNQESTTMLERFKQRPKYRHKAPLQISFEDKASKQRQLPMNLGDASLYNVWFDKWYTEGKDKYGGLANPDQKAISRCNPAKDSGLTKADLNGARDAFFCIYFAKGQCGKGWQCRYLHRVPTQEDEEYIERTFDCFGRQKHKADRQDYMGVGSFERECRALSVLRLGAYDADDYERVIRKHFSQYGDIVKIKSLPHKQAAIVKFSCRLNAEFAKEAMQEQSLDLKEVIIVKWAPDDVLDEEDEQNDLAQIQARFVKHLVENQELPAVQSILSQSRSEQDLNEYFAQSGSDDEQQKSIEQADVERVQAKSSEPQSLLPSRGRQYSQVPPPPPPKRK
ncbi:hypothetical protein MP228_008290 [Amoeboaphelidium protococcarum]|nr:hypothetical protein MP228_008290 [Amoeboaphelidium protococcarum]